MDMMRANRMAACVASALLCVLLTAQAAYAEDATVAIVEDTSGKIIGVEPLDLLRAGKVIALKSDEGLIISYLNSCQRENIRGGKVIIGQAQSEVAGGTVARTKLTCDPVALALSPEQANQSATLVFREPPQEKGIDFLLVTRQPIVIAPEVGEVILEQLEKKQSTRTFKVTKGVADLTVDYGPLDQGGLYRLTAGGKVVTFRVGKEATDAPLPLLKRVIRV